MELRQTKYKQTEVGLIPEDWVVKELGQLAKVIGGGTPKTTVSEYWNGEIIWFTPTEVGSQKYLTSSERKISVEGLQNSSAQILPVGTILLTTRAGIGDLGILTKEAATNQGFQSLVVTSEYDNEYVYYLLTTLKQNLHSRASGSTFLEISPSKVKEITAGIPPTLSEQKNVAQVLSDTDALIQALEKKITKKRDIKKGVIQKVLTPKQGWIRTPLTEVVDYIHGKAHEQHIVEFGKYVVVNSKFISKDGTIVKYSNSNFCKAKSGDILTVLSDLPNGNALAKCFYVSEDDKYAINQRICIWRPKKGNYPMFLKYLLDRNKYFLALDDGVTQTHILNHHIEKCEISIPASFEEQKKIGTILFDLDQEIAQLEQKHFKYQLTKQGLIQQLLTGKIRLV